MMTPEPLKLFCANGPPTVYWARGEDDDMREIAEFVSRVPTKMADVWPWQVFTFLHPKHEIEFKLRWHEHVRTP